MNDTLSYEVELRYLIGQLGNGQKQPQTIEIQVWDAGDEDLNQSQELAIEYLVSNESKVYELIRNQVYSHYKKSYLIYESEVIPMAKRLWGATDDQLSQMFPRVVAGDELDLIAEFDEIHLHPPLGDIPKIGVSLDVQWDAEHGVGVLMQGLLVDAVGPSDIAWVSL